ncbi:MAG: hypothetical protein M3069_09760 [Chloroflexota bacterium]|nr:hypothetical protein [Chloroflexota bacterium]
MGRTPAVFDRLSLARVDAWVLGVTGLAAFALALRLAGAEQQSAYMDEGTNVLTGRMLIEQHAIYAEVLNWSYGSFLWPLLAGAADELGGLRLVRGVTAVCGVLMVLATAAAAAQLAPETTGRARRRVVALLAGAIMAVAPTAIGVGRFGTYDALAGAGFMLGVMLLVPASKPRSRGRLLLAAALLFVAFLAKYLVAIYFPFICVYVVLGALLSTRSARSRPGMKGDESGGGGFPRRLPLSGVAKRAPGRDRHMPGVAGLTSGLLSLAPQVRSAVHTSVWFVVPLAAACAVYAWVFLGALLTLLTASLGYGDLKSPDPLREYVWTRPELWLLVGAAAVGGRFALGHGRLVAVGGAAIIMAFQLVAHPDFDFWKHSIYVVYFLAPLAAMTWLAVPQNTGTWRMVALGAAAVTCAWTWSSAIQQADQLIEFYPNLNPSLAAIEANIAGSALVLTDDTALRYYLYPGMPADHVVGPFAFAYRSQSRLDAYRQAISDRFFDAIVLDGGVTPQGAAIRDQLGQVIRDAYQPVYSHTDGGGFTVDVWKPVRPAGASRADSSGATWPIAYTFEAGLDGWGAHPDAADWQAGLQIASSTEQAQPGHVSLRFMPTPGSSTLSLRRAGHITRVRAQVYLVSADGSSSPLRVGFVAFDDKWQWRDDGFRWQISSGSWTTITWDLANPGDFEEVGLKFPSSVGQVYVDSFEIDP